MRRVLQKHGFVVQERLNDVLVIEPAADGDTSFVDQVAGEVEAEAEDSQAVDEESEQRLAVTFGLERDMQQALRANIGQLEQGLTIKDGGHEYTTEAGRIDILAADSNDNPVVIELKAGMARPEAITQLLAYMGTVSIDSSEPVSGILIAGEFHPRVLQAARVLPNVRLMRYSFNFSFEPLGGGA